MATHHPIRKLVSPDAPVIPDKLYFRIGDVARLCDVPAYVLRFWETEFPQLKPNKGGTGQRLYRKRDVEMALRIKTLLYDQGYTIPGARQVFKSESKSEPRSNDIPDSVPDATPQPPVPSMDIGAAIRHEAQLRDQITHLRDELRSLTDLLNHPSSPAPATSGNPESPLAAKLKPMRPRLVLEPKPAPASEPKPEPKPHLLNQGDLFPTE